MSPSLVISFRSEVSLIESSEEQAVVESPRGKITLSELTPGLLSALRILSSGGATEDDISDLVMAKDGAATLGLLYYHLERCGNLGLLSYTLIADGQHLITVVPMRRSFRFNPTRVVGATRVGLSRFAYCRREGDALVLESPLSLARAIVPGRLGAELVGELAQPRAYRDLSASVEGLPEDTAQAFLSLLANEALVVEVGDDGTLAEEDPPLAQWAFHDLLFHSRSRMGRHDYSFGATFPFLGKIPPLSALKPRMSDEVIALYKPNIYQLEKEDLPFTYILENRQSIRDYGGQPINAEQLGEFLYRVARVRRIIEADPAQNLHYQVSNRPYPSGGATYDLELYVAVNTCEGVPSGIYHYDPLNHWLCKLGDRNTHVEALLRDAQYAAALLCEPQVLI